MHLLIGGPTGVGLVGLRIGPKACREGFSVLYRRARSGLFTMPPSSAAPGRLAGL